MGLNRPLGDFAQPFNSLYKINLDVSNYDKTIVQVAAPFVGAIYVYGSNDAGAIQGVTQGNASLAINFTPVQVTNLATGTASGVISAAGEYRYDVNAQFLRLQGNPAGSGTSVYKLLLNNQKSS